MADFYEMDFIEHIVILGKVAECKILKSLLINRFWMRDGIG